MSSIAVIGMTSVRPSARDSVQISGALWEFGTLSWNRGYSERGSSIKGDHGEARGRRAAKPGSREAAARLDEG